MTTDQMHIIGRAERADFPDLSLKGVPVKIDTGADASSIWAHASEMENGRLHVIFFSEGNEFYTGEEHVFEPDEFTMTRVANSFGHREFRYKVKLRIRVKRRTINGTFTLADRSQKLYPVLIGRTLLMKKFLVDVSKGNPLKAEERRRAEKLANEMEADR